MATLESLQQSLDDLDRSIDRANERERNLAEAASDFLDAYEHYRVNEAVVFRPSLEIVNRLRRVLGRDIPPSEKEFADVSSVSQGE